MSARATDAQKLLEAQRRYAALTEQIAAIDRDLATEMDSERREALEDRRRDAATRRDGVMAEISGLPATAEGFEGRVHGLEQRVTLLERLVRPPWQVRLWRLAATLVALFALGLVWIDETRTLLFEALPGVGIVGELVLLGFAAVLWRMADVTLERLK